MDHGSNVSWEHFDFLADRDAAQRERQCGNQNVQDTFNMVHLGRIRREGSVPDLRRSSKQRGSLGLKERAEKTPIRASETSFKVAWADPNRWSVSTLMPTMRPTNVDPRTKSMIMAQNRSGSSALKGAEEG